MGYKDPDQQREYMRLWIAKRRSNWFAGKSCVQCGSIDNLELDHIDRATKVDHRIWSWSQERQEKEIAKCQVLCEKCHLVKTISEISLQDFHGTYGGYRNHNCRCETCKAANAERSRNLRKRIKLAARV